MYMHLAYPSDSHTFRQCPLFIFCQSSHPEDSCHLLHVKHTYLVSMCFCHKSRNGNRSYDTSQHVPEVKPRQVRKQSWPCTGSYRAERPRAAPCCYCSWSQIFPGRPARAVEKHITVRFQSEICCPLPIHTRM